MRLPLARARSDGPLSPLPWPSTPPPTHTHPLPLSQTMGTAYVPLTGKAAAEAKAAVVAVAAAAAGSSAGGGMTPLVGKRKVEAWMGSGGYKKPPPSGKKRGPGK